MHNTECQTDSSPINLRLGVVKPNHQPLCKYLDLDKHAHIAVNRYSTAKMPLGELRSILTSANDCLSVLNVFNQALSPTEREEKE